MADPRLPHELAKKTTKPQPRMRNVLGQAAAAQTNREREGRLRITQTLCRLGIPHNQWPGFVRAFYTDPSQQIKYTQTTTPAPFQAPEFDRLNQSPEEWVKEADRAWEQHRQRFLQECEDWVSEGVDEEIVQPKRVRRPKKKMRGHAEGQGRGENTPIHRRAGLARHASI